MEDSIEKLTEYFKEFPGIGERQAKRFVYFLLRKNPQFVSELGNNVLNLKKNIHQCPSCFLFFQSSINGLCDNCKNPKIDKSSLLVIEKDSDYENIKKSRSYNGYYFILGGLAPIISKEILNYLRVKELLNIVEMRSKNGDLKEIILALSLNPQGEHTDLFLREKLDSLVEKYDLRIVSLGRGLSTGTELEYSDSETIKNALKNRQ